MKLWVWRASCDCGYKGFKTATYRIKKKLFKERYGQDIEER